MIAIVVASVALPRIKHPFSGGWKANVARSQLGLNHLFQSIVLVIEIIPDGVLLTSVETDLAGEEQSHTRKIRPDNKEYVVYNDPGVVEIARWDSPHILVEAVKKDGQVIRQSRYEISDDESTLTVTVQYRESNGEQLEEVIRFELE